MSAGRQYTAADLLGLGPLPKQNPILTPAPEVRLPRGTGPRLDVLWGSFHQGTWSSIIAIFTGPSAPRRFRPSAIFKDCWIERRIPRRAVVAAALWHVAIFILPWPNLTAALRHNPAFDNVELTWSGPINDLPPIALPGPKAKPSPRGEPNKPMPPRGADAFHPRQRIFTDPVRPTHPRQTLSNPAAPNVAPKILPNLPNMVELGPSSVPARPKIQISAEALAKLRPRQRRVATVAPADAPALTDAPNLSSQIGEMNLATPANAPARPKLEIHSGSAPRIADRTQAGESSPAPELGSAIPNVASGGSSTFIALSATPAAPALIIQPPQGNLAARVSISPEGGQHGVPGGAENGTPGSTGGTGGGPGSGGGAGTGSGGNSTSVSISGGQPKGSSGISGLGGGSGRLHLPTGRSLSARPDTAAAAEEAPPVRTAPPNFAALPPGSKPEAVFGPARVYTLYVNMPNLNSATGSWILNFSELRTDPSGPRIAAAVDLSGPVPVRKVDPKYPPNLIKERVEGEVILYAVIRRDGSVDSIQLVRGIDDQLDSNAMQALAQWKFRPADRQGSPVELETVVHIPFRAAAPE